MGENTRELADFQNALLSLLDSDLSAREMLQRLHTAPEFQAYQAYISSFELPMLEVAAELVKKWGHRVDQDRS